jgi:STE24 endopeptidase
MHADLRARRQAWLLLAVLVAVFVAMVVTLTPWDPTSGLTINRPSADEFFTPEQIARSEAFHDDIKWPSWLSVLAGLVFAVLLGFSRVGRRLADLGMARSRRWWVQVLVLVIVVSIAQRVVTLPFAIWGRSVARDYGLATNTWAEWAADVLKSLGISMVLTSLALLALVALARKFTRHWFIAAATGSALLVLALSFLYPIAFEPLFNKFTSMPDGPLKTRLVALAAEDGIEVSDVLVADASRRTTALNAYVSGFGATKRIVVYDNLITKAPRDEVSLVVAHELSHAKHDDVLVGTIEGAVGAAIAMVLLYLALTTDRVRRPVRAESPGDPRVVPLVVALVALAGFASLPIQNGLSRQVEMRADTHSLELTGEADTFVSMQKRISTSNISNLHPNPVLSFWFSSHPTTLDRLGLAQAFERQSAEGSR